MNMNNGYQAQPKKVSVIIAGEANTGRTTLAYQIARLLPQVGIPTLPYRDPEDLYQLETEELNRISRHLGDKIVAKELQVEIATVQLQRPSIASKSEYSPQGIEAIYHRGLLVNAIDQFLRQAGVIAQDAAPLSGPECLYHLELFGQHLALENQKDTERAT